MSIKLKDTIYDLINNADKLDGSHLTDIIRYYTPSSSNVLNLDDLKSTTGFQVTGWAYAGSPYVNGQPDGDGASSAATVIKFPGNYPFQIYRFYSNNNIKVRGYYSGTGWTSWATILTSDNYTTYCASASHSHNYASTVKVGSTSYTCSSNVISLPAYPTSLKCPKSLTIQLNGTSQGAWDGSVDKTINITPASISASAASHTHNYAGSSSAGGAATSANKLNTTSFSASTDINFNYTFWTASGACSDISSMGYAAVMNVGSDLYRGWQIWNSRNDHKLYWRPAISDASTWKSTPHIILDSNNWSSYCAAASHTHSGYASSSHTHNYAGSSSAGGAATSANKLNTNAGDAYKPVYFTNGIPTECTYGFNGSYYMPVVLAAGYIYKSSYTSTTWTFSGTYCPALTGGITTSVSGGVLAVTWTQASGRYRYIYGAVANMRTSGAVTSYSGTEYEDRSLGMYWLGTATSTSTTYIRAMCQGNENNDTGISYDEMWGTSSQQSDHCILSFSIIVIGYWT